MIFPAAFGVSEGPPLTDGFALSGLPGSPPHFLQEEKVAKLLKEFSAFSPPPLHNDIPGPAGLIKKSSLKVRRMFSRDDDAEPRNTALCYD